MISFRIDSFDHLAIQGFSRVFSSTTFKNINSLTLSLLYGPTLTSVRDYWKNHSSDYPDFFFDKVTALLFNTLSGFVIAFLPKEQASFNFVAAVTIHSDFGTQENKICHSSMFSLSLPGSDGRVWLVLHNPESLWCRCLWTHLCLSLSGSLGDPECHLASVSEPGQQSSNHITRGLYHSLLSLCPHSTG